jgi:hypothetical protein
MLKNGGLPQILSSTKVKFSECTNHNKLVFHRSTFRIVTGYMNSTATLQSIFIFSADMFVNVLLCFGKTVRKKKRGKKKTAHFDTSSYTWLQNIHMLHPMHKQLSFINHHLKTNYYNTSAPCMSINEFQSYTSVSMHFLMMGLTHQRFNCMARCLTKVSHVTRQC